MGITPACRYYPSRWGISVTKSTNNRILKFSLVAILVPVEYKKHASARKFCYSGLGLGFFAVTGILVRSHTTRSDTIPVPFESFSTSKKYWWLFLLIQSVCKKFIQGCIISRKKHCRNYFIFRHFFINILVILIYRSSNVVLWTKCFSSIISKLLQ